MNNREYYTREITLGNHLLTSTKGESVYEQIVGFVWREAYCLLAKLEVNYTSLKITRIAEEIL